MAIAYRRHRFRVYPTPRQERLLAEWSRVCTEVWNAAVEQRRRLYRDYTAVETDDGTWRIKWDRSPGGVSLDSGRSGPGAWVPGLPRQARILDHQGEPIRGQVRQLQEARAELPWLAAVPANVTNAVLYRLDRAYQDAWRRLRAGRPAGFPRFRRHRRVAVAFPSIGATHRLISSPPGSRIMWLHISGARGGKPIGRLRCRTHIPLDGHDLGELTVWERNGRWWGSIVLRVPQVTPPGWPDPDRPRIVGINRGVVHLLTTDQGVHVPPIQLPEGDLRRLKHLERKAARQHRTNNAGLTDRRGRMLPGRRRVFSRREMATRQQIARLRERHANIRREQLSLLVNRLLDEHDIICIERFDIQGLLRRRREDDEMPVERMRDLRRRIAEQAWGEMATMLRYRAADRGKLLIEVDPRDISSTCPRCGAITDPGFSRVFRCGRCGHIEDVDVVAARNVRAGGEALLEAERARARARSRVAARRVAAKT